MQPRTLFAILATGLFVATGVVAAQSASTEAAPAQAGFLLKATPAEVRLAPGASASVSIVFEARTAKDLTFQVRAPDHLRVALSATDANAAPGAAGRIALTIAAPEDASKERSVIVVRATDDDGLHREARIAILVGAAQPPRPDERPHDARTEPAARPGPQQPPPRAPMAEARIDARASVDTDAAQLRMDRLELRFLGLMQRLEKALDRIEAPDRPRDAPAPAARMTLSQTHALVGPDGTKVALLLAGGDHDARVRLAVRANETAGWKIALEQEQVFVRAHERAWIWIELAAREDAGPLDYAIVQVGTPGPAFVKGYATTGMA